MDGFDLGLGILFPLFPEKARPRRHHEQRRAGLGRQRNLAGARRRRPDGGISAGLCGADAGALHAHDRDADRPGVSRRRLRIPLAHDTGERNHWDIAFAGGSLLATLAQGIALGAILQGVHVEGRHYAGGWWDWLTPFSILTGVALVIGYALLGATWLVMKTEGELARPRLSSELVAADRDARAPSARSASRRRSSMCSTRSAGSPGRTSS